MKKKLLLWGCGAFAGLVAIGVVADLVTPRDPRGLKTGPPATVSTAEVTATRACERHLRAELHFPKSMALSNVRVGFSEDRSWAAVVVDVAYENAFGDTRTWHIACKVWSSGQVETALPN